MRIAPGPPHYQYGAHMVEVIDGTHLIVDLRMKYLRVDAEGDRDYGLGLRRVDGWLVRRTPVQLAGCSSLPGAAADYLRHQFATTTACVVRIEPERSRTWEVGPFLATIQILGETQTVNERMHETWVAI